MTNDENYLRAVEFRRPEWIPVNISIMPATWQKYREALEDVVLRHPVLFGPMEKGERDFDHLPHDYRQGEWTDDWGCVWRNLSDGMIGQVVGHPLADWDNFDSYTPPDPLGGVDWDEQKRNFDEAKKRGNLARGSVGNLFHQSTFLRGYEGLMTDIAADSPAIHQLLAMLTEYIMKQVRKQLEIGADMVGLGDDLGINDRLAISPAHFRRYFGPCYATIFGACRDAGAHVYLHTDGRIVDIMEDLIDYGVTVLNPEEQPNGLDEIAARCKGRICIDLTVAQQRMPFMTASETFSYFKEIVTKLGSKEGGLILLVEIEPDVPLENIKWILQAAERYRTCWSSAP